MNYLNQILTMTEEAEPGKVNHITVEHDSWCAVFEGKPCNCNPEASWGKSDESDGQDASKEKSNGN